jgi:hypothetical protein
VLGAGAIRAGGGEPWCGVDLAATNATIGTATRPRITAAIRSVLVTRPGSRPCHGRHRIRGTTVGAARALAFGQKPAQPPGLGRVE